MKAPVVEIHQTSMITVPNLKLLERLNLPMRGHVHRQIYRSSFTEPGMALGYLSKLSISMCTASLTKWSRQPVTIAVADPYKILSPSSYCKFAAVQYTRYLSMRSIEVSGLVPDHCPLAGVKT